MRCLPSSRLEGGVSDLGSYLPGSDNGIGIDK
jgi:hypothetical protein